SQSLPGYVVMPDRSGALEAGQPMYANGFLPAIYQPTMLGGGPRPIRNLDLPPGVSLPQRRATVRLIRDLTEADLDPADGELAARTDKPVAGLLHDLKRRGLLDSTLVLWGGEFGRSPEAQGGKGRDHHNLGFSMWLAGGGIKGGRVVGATDAIGLRAVEQPYH